ncbi:metallophosphoesterase [Aggregicoccus sp. 17bor-14]|uniref:metallophosphoesterase n=1 Tax=Myxococcaceae TaxID=31 RepID=UPI00129C2497|nr:MULTISPECIES: metallophosphoesterase [Myxococcaceae]MBF5045608.1 metallophosphoesterase [Simulacricoccus sp. 17bor-14]MRI91345.1 metallophosphoesterase [Aggregicoccus sp. 17bor-14]
MFSTRFLLPSLVLTLAAFAVLRVLAPRWSHGRCGLGFWGAALLGQVGWLLALADVSGRAMGPLQLLGAAWLAVVGIVALAGMPFVVALGLGRVVRRLSRRTRLPLDPSRRRFLEGALPAGALAVGVGGSVQVRPFEVRREEVRLPGLPHALDGFRIGQLSDLHVGPFIDPEHVRRAVRALDEEGVDLQVMTGDLIDDMELLAPTFEALESCAARHGMLAILGNHEKWRGLSAVLGAYRACAPRGRVRLLVDESALLEHAGARLRVVGVDYPLVGRHEHGEAQRRQMATSAERAFAGVQAGETLLCLSHHPDFFPFAAERGAQLTLSGHTHGGQVGLFRLPLFRFAFEHILGRYRRGGAHLYVSAGTGHWFPFRVGIPTEVTVITLRSA